MPKNIDQVYEKLLPLLARHSPDSLSFSKVSRWVGVPRSTLYYYFGNNINVMILEAVKVGAKSFVQTAFVKNYSKFSSYYEFQCHVIRQSYEFVRRFSFAPTLYLRYRTEPGMIGAEIQRIEKEYFQMYAEAWTYFNKTKPDVSTIRTLTYMKIGVLYGLETDYKDWFSSKSADHLDRLVSYMAKISSETHKI